jgi:3-hydroxyisobutyrate dehydrogenase-like beta-hydroxyacid dehydrogenase
MKRHLSKPDELLKAMKRGIIKAGEWITTSINSKPETIIMKYEEGFSIEMTFKDLKSYLKRATTATFSYSVWSIISYNI